MSVAAKAWAAELRIAERFVGPAGIGNGGYSCGTFAALVDGPAQVTLRRPVPLERALKAGPGADGSITVSDEAGTIAEVTSIEGLGALEPPVRPGSGQARPCRPAGACSTRRSSGRRSIARAFPPSGSSRTCHTCWAG